LEEGCIATRVVKDSYLLLVIHLVDRGYSGWDEAETNHQDRHDEGHHPEGLLAEARGEFALDDEV
jgi:hypothetical protein